MRLYTIVTPGLEHIAQQEIKELLNTKARIAGSVLECTVKSKKEAATLAEKGQSFRRVLFGFWSSKTLDKLDLLKLRIQWDQFFPGSFSFKIEVEGVKGQENRLRIAKDIAGKLFSVLEGQGLKPSLELKNPNFLIIVYCTGTKYYLGLDVAGKELNIRKYRLFPHSASFKGDLAYYFIRTSCFRKGEKLLVGFVRDGALAIEAARFAPASAIVGIDGAQGNIIAARKNAALARIRIELHRCAIDELDVKFSPEEFDRALFHLTTKDEGLVNEIFHQGAYILKPRGTLFFITRQGLDISPPPSYILKRVQAIAKGDQTYKTWLFQRRSTT